MEADHFGEVLQRAPQIALTDQPAAALFVVVDPMPVEDLGGFVVLKENKLQCVVADQLRQARLQTACKERVLLLDQRIDFGGAAIFPHAEAVQQVRSRGYAKPVHDGGRRPEYPHLPVMFGDHPGGFTPGAPSITKSLRAKLSQPCLVLIERGPTDSPVRIVEGLAKMLANRVVDRFGHSLVDGDLVD